MKSMYQTLSSVIVVTKNVNMYYCIIYTLLASRTVVYHTCVAIKKRKSLISYLAFDFERFVFSFSATAFSTKDKKSSTFVTLKSNVVCTSWGPVSVLGSLVIFLMS